MPSPRFYPATMNAYPITQTAKRFDLSRSTLLYYDRIGLLRPSGRTPAGYRLYTAKDIQRLARICHFREAGLALADIKTMLSAGKPRASVLENRLKAASDQIVDLRRQQRLLTRLLKGVSKKGIPAAVDKDLWVAMMRAAGMSDDAMRQWHAEFEKRSPHGHQEFLASLGLPESEIRRVRSGRFG